MQYITVLTEIATFVPWELTAQYAKSPVIPPTIIGVTSFAKKFAKFAWKVFVPLVVMGTGKEHLTKVRRPADAVDVVTEEPVFEMSVWKKLSVPELLWENTDIPVVPILPLQSTILIVALEDDDVKEIPVLFEQFK